MSRTVYGRFIFTNGVTETCMSHEQAYAYCVEHKCDIEYAFSDCPIIGRRRDSFQSGYQPQLGRYVGGPGEYQKILKEKGLVEMGNTPSKSYKTSERIDGELINDIKNMCKDISDREIDAISKGEKLHNNDIS